MSRKAVHLGQDLIERLLVFIMPAEDPSTACSPDRIDFINENNCGADLAGFGEEFSDTAGAYTDDHFDELGGTGAKERYMCLARCGAGQKRLSRPRRSSEQHS